MIELKTVEEEFTKFVNNYEKIDRVKLKEKHTKNVADFSYKISKWFAEDINNKDIIEQAGGKESFVNLAVTIGWLHDIGRFEQASKYNSFNDRNTFDHAQKGVEILKNNNYISKYCSEKSFYDTIYLAIYNHNKLKIEEGLNEFDLVQCRIIRDADKLDILRLYKERLEVFKKDEDNAKVSLKIIQDLQEKRNIKKEDKKSEIDDYLLSLGFVFDMNYKKSFELLKELDYINIIIDKINIYITKEEQEKMENIRMILNREIECKLNK